MTLMVIGAHNSAMLISSINEFLDSFMFFR